MMKDEVVEINDKLPCAESAKSLSERIYRPSEYSVRICFVLLVFGNLCSTPLGALSVLT